MLLTAFAIIRLMDCGCQLVLDRFRLLRTKKVDMVLEAFYLAHPTPDVDTTEPAVAPIAWNEPVRSESQELCQALIDRIKLHANEDPFMDDRPIFLHRQYMREEALVGLGLPQLVGAHQAQTGRFWLEAINTEIFDTTPAR